MKTCYLQTPLLLPFKPTLPPKNHHNFSHFLKPPLENNRISHFTPPSAKGFGLSKKKPAKKSEQTKKNITKQKEEEEEEEDGDSDDEDGGVIPEIVTNRMIRRMGLSVGIPLLTGLMFFPLFWYLKVGMKVDIPSWVPFIVSFVFFGTALLGVSYGIVSTSWDPLREGSLLGWNEAKLNWPVFWHSFKGKSPNR